MQIAILLIGTLMIALSILINTKIWDYTVDGNTYHKAILYFLSHGWNPLKESFFSYRDANFAFLDYITAPWYDAYPKLTETWGACLHYLMGTMEAGKSFNMIGILAAICIIYYYLSEMTKFSKWKNFVFGIFFVLNPISISQMFTYYNDAFLWEMWLICCIALIYLTCSHQTVQKCSVESYALIFLTIGIGLNTKFSALIFFGILCIVFFAYWCLKTIREKSGNKNWFYTVRKKFVFFVLSVCSAVLFVGTNSYVSNFLRYHNPIYGTFGEGSVDIITTMLAPVYCDIPKPFSFIASVFSKTSNSSTATEVLWKIPFTVSPEEIECTKLVDPRIGGWGILFSGIFLISIVILFFTLRKRFESDKHFREITLLLITINIIYIVAIPGLCWARYYIIPLYLPVLALIFLQENSDGKRFEKFVSVSIIVLLILNFCPNCQAIQQQYIGSKDNKVEYLKLQRIANDSLIQIDTTISDRREGIYLTIYDMGLTNIEFVDVENSEDWNMLYLPCLIPYRIISEQHKWDSIETALNSLCSKDMKITY